MKKKSTAAELPTLRAIIREYRGPAAKGQSTAAALVFAATNRIREIKGQPLIRKTTSQPELPIGTPLPQTAAPTPAAPATPAVDAELAAAFAQLGQHLDQLGLV